MADSNGISAQISLEGLYQGRQGKVFHILGQRSDWVDITQFQDIAEFLDPPFAAFPELDGTENFEIVSNSAADTAAGTGTRTLEIVYIDANYALAARSVTMNGLTPVQLGVMGARMFLWMEAVTGGSSQVGVGRIFLRITGGGVVHDVISEGSNKSLTARFMVPDGYECIIPSWDTHAIRTAMDCRLRATVNTRTRQLQDRYTFQDLASMGADASDEHSLPYLKFPARCKLKVSAIPASLAGTPRLDCSFTVILVQGD